MAGRCLITRVQSMPHKYCWFAKPFQKFCFWNGQIQELGQFVRSKLCFFSTQWNPGLIVWMIYNFWLCVWTKNYLANPFDQVGTVIRTREKWKIQFGTDDKSNLKFMFQSEGDHNMSSFEADLKKQILGRWEYLRKWFGIKSFFLSTSQF